LSIKQAQITFKKTKGARPFSTIFEISQHFSQHMPKISDAREVISGGSCLGLSSALLKEWQSVTTRFARY
jgi:hypothetical protein